MTSRDAIVRSLYSYGIFILWLIQDSIWRRKGAASVVFLSGVMGVGGQVAVFGLIIVYARHFSAGELLTIAGYSVDPRSSIWLLGGGGILVVLLLILSVFCIFYSRREILRMGREYEEYCAQRVFRLLGEGGDLFSAMDDGTAGESYLFRLVKSDSRLAGRVLRMLLSLVIPGATLVVTAAVLVYLELVLTLVIGVLAAIFLYYQYHVSRRAAQYSMRFEKLASASGGEYRALIQHYKHLPRADGSSALTENLFAEGPVKKQLDAYEGRLRAVENSKLVSGVFMAVVVGLIILVMGVGIIREGAGWGRLLVYVVALRFAMVSLQGVFSTITSINRFYPQVGRYFAFVRSFSHQSRSRGAPKDVYILEVTGDAVDNVLEGSAPALEIRRGMCFAFVTPLELNRYSLAGLVNSLLGEDGGSLDVLYTARYASVDHSRPAMPLRQALSLSGETTWDDLRPWCPDEELWEKVRRQLPGSLDKSVTSRQWEKVSPDVKFLLSLISARLEGCSWIFMQAEGLRHLGPGVTRFYLESSIDSVGVVVHNHDFELVGSFDEQAVAVADERKLVGLGSLDWFARVTEDVSEATGIGTRRTGRAAQEEALDDELLE